MENKENLKAQYNQKLYSEAEKDNFVREAVAKQKESVFESFKESIDCLITERLLAFCNAHPAIFKLEKQTTIVRCS